MSAAPADRHALPPAWPGLRILALPWLVWLVAFTLATVSVPLERETGRDRFAAYVQLYLTAAVTLRLVVGVAVRERGRGWLAYFALLFSSLLWAPALADLEAAAYARLWPAAYHDEARPTEAQVAAIAGVNLSALAAAAALVLGARALARRLRRGAKAREEPS